MKTIESSTLMEGQMNAAINKNYYRICTGKYAEQTCLFLSTLAYRDITTNTIMIWADRDIEGMALFVCGISKKRYRKMCADFAERGIIEYVRRDAWKLNHERIEELVRKAA